jgi:hypothetical protein
MPHSHALWPASAGAAVVIAAISTTILGGAVILAGPGSGPLARFAEPMMRRLCKSLGFGAPSVALVADSQSVVTAAPGARIAVAGRILDAEGSPVAGSAVRVRSESRPSWDWVTTSGSDGSFRVEGVAAGKVQVAAQDVEAGYVESAPMDANEARQVVLVLDRTVEIAGVVLDERGAPIPRATVKCTGKSGAPDRVVIADEDGRFTMRRAARSIDRVTVWARGFEATTIAAGAASDATQRSVRLRAGRPLRGRVVSPTGEVVAGARVSACAGHEAEVATSDGAGAFEFPATVIGCTIAAYHPRFAGARPTRIGDGREVVVRLGSGGAIEGMAVDEHGKSIGLFSVTIASFEAGEEAPGTPTRAGETAEHLRGSFRLDDLAPGTYVLRFSAEGKVDTDSNPIEVARGKVVRGEQIVLASAEVEDSASGGDEPEPAGAARSGDASESAGSTEPAETKEATSGE